MTDLTGQQIAQARCRALGVLASFFRDGPRIDTLAVLRKMPGLEHQLPATAPEDTTTEQFADDLAAAHYEWTGRQVVVSEQVFLSPQGLMGGIEHDLLDEALFHLLSLENGRLQALQANAQQDVEAIEHAQLAFLDKRLLRWLPVLVVLLKTVTGEGFAAGGAHREAADLTLHLARQMWTERGGESTEWSLPPLPPLLEESGTGLRAISRQLTTPALAGGHLCLVQFKRIGIKLELPIGFGSRADTLENLFAAAARYGKVAQLIDALTEPFAQWAQSLDSPWTQRIAETERVLQKIKAATDQQD